MARAGSTHGSRWGLWRLFRGYSTDAAAPLRRTAFLLLLAMLCLPALVGTPIAGRAHLSARTATPDARRLETAARASDGALLRLAAFDRLPLAFEANQGQTGRCVRFIARGRGYAAFFTDSDMVLALAHLHRLSSRPAMSSPVPVLAHASRRGNGGPDVPALQADAATESVIRVHIVGGAIHPTVMGQHRLPGTQSYLSGAVARRWHRAIPTYARVAYQNEYRGIDLMYYGAQGHIEDDWVVRPGASPQRIRLHVTGASRLSLDRQGRLVLRLPGGTLYQDRPILYQRMGRLRRVVRGGYLLLPGQRVGFWVGSYDRRAPLVIDPVLQFATYLGGGDDDVGTAIAMDGAGNVYIAGTTASATFPTTPGALHGPGGGSPNSDVFVAKLNASGTALLYSDVLGGTSNDAGNGLAVDSAGDAYVTGVTDSSDFPTKNPLQGQVPGGSSGFVAELSPDGTSLIYSTYLTAQVDYAIAVDGTGSAYVTGMGADVTKIAPGGRAIVYSRFIGDGAQGDGLAIAVDSAGEAYVTGQTNVINFPVTPGALQQTNGGGCSGGTEPICFDDAFVTKLSADGTQLLYSTYLGGSGSDMGQSIAVDGAGDAYVTGGTNSPDFPLLHPLPGMSGGAFVSKLNASGTALLYSTTFGGNGATTGNAIAVDAAGDAFVAGATASTDFPLQNPVQSQYAGGILDAFVVALRADDSGLLFGTYLGGSGSDRALGIALDSTGNPAIVGATTSTDFPVHAPLQACSGSGPNGTDDVFVAKIAAVTTAVPTPTPALTSTPCPTPTSTVTPTPTATATPVLAGSGPPGSPLSVTFLSSGGSWAAWWEATGRILLGNGDSGTCAGAGNQTLTCDIPTNATPGLGLISVQSSTHANDYVVSYLVTGPSGGTSSPTATPTTPASLTPTALPPATPTVPSSATPTAPPAASPTSTATHIVMASATPTTTSAPTPPPTVTQLPPGIALTATVTPGPVVEADTPPPATATPTDTMAPPPPPSATTAQPPLAPTNTTAPPAPTSTTPPAPPGAPATAGASHGAAPGSTPGTNTILMPTDTPLPSRDPTSHLKSAGKPRIPVVSVPGGIVSYNTLVTIRALTRPNTTVAITAKLSTSTVTLRQVVMYVRIQRKKGGASKPHIVGPASGKRPPCGKRVQGCVARWVRRRVIRTTMLYQTTTHVRSEKRGRLDARVRLTYTARKAMRATLTIVLRTPRGAVTSSSTVRLMPAVSKGKRHKR